MYLPIAWVIVQQNCFSLFFVCNVNKQIEGRSIYQEKNVTRQKPDSFGIQSAPNLTRRQLPLIFSISCGYRPLHDVRLLAKPKYVEQYSKELYSTLLM